jgi:hypothetical protein
MPFLKELTKEERYGWFMQENGTDCIANFYCTRRDIQ